MPLFSPELHRLTPEVTVLSNRGQPVREIRYHRHTDTLDVTDERITRHQYNVGGQQVSSTDPRLHDLMQTPGSQVRPNFQYYVSLTGEVLKTVSADAGTTLLLEDAAGRPSVSRSADGVITRWNYEPGGAGRLLYISEKIPGEKEKITERFVYAENTLENRAHNLAGSCIAHYDTAGMKCVEAMSLTGQPISVTQQLLKDNEDADWKGDDEAVWQQKFVPEVYRTETTYDPAGTVLTQTDAKGNVHHHQYNVTGLLKSSGLKLKGETATDLFQQITYSASGQKQKEIHGNGIVSTWIYEPETQRLTGIKVERPPTHPKGSKVFQDLHYTYDPTGNVLSVEDRTEKTRFWRNRKIEPKNTYLYDTLYQLVRTTGREMAPSGRGVQITLPEPVCPVADDTLYTPYTRYYTYDRGDNLIRIRHHAPESRNSHTTDILVSDRSNRGVLRLPQDTLPAGQVDDLFHAGGHQKELLKGQPLAWTRRGELASVNMTGTDTECYRYGTASQRVTKITTRHHSGSVHKEKVIYLGSLEIRTRHQDGILKEELHRISAGSIQFLNWETGSPEGTDNSQQRHSHSNIINSSGLELDQNGQLISREEYYPYGGTAVWAARSQAEASYKTLRYSGKERDASGLYYYGYRYYQSWTGRWLSADSAGTVDGLNLFRMVNNNPVSHYDSDGLMDRQGKKRKHSDSEVSSTDSTNIDAFPETPGTSSGTVNPQSAATEKVSVKSEKSLKSTINLDEIGKNISLKMNDKDKMISVPEYFYLKKEENINNNLEMLLTNDRDINERVNFINELKNQPHYLLGNNTITTKTEDNKNIFYNSYYPDVWIARYNKHEKNNIDFFGSDVSIFQYVFVSKKEGFFGHLPSKIILDKIINPDTFNEMKNKKDSGSSMLMTFLNKTPVGISTKRVLEKFGMEVYKISPLEQGSYEISLKKKS